MEKFRDKYRNESARAPWWDYSNDGCYFITICTVDRDLLFGNIINAEMFLSDIGQIVLQEWEKSFEIRAELFCDAFVIMPNHIHAILRIDKQSDKKIVRTDGRPSPQIGDHPINYGVAYRPPKSISSFAAGFKSAATTRINIFRFVRTHGRASRRVWQPRFHDHIIRNDQEYNRIKDYIETNPVKWEQDKFFKNE